MLVERREGLWRGGRVGREEGELVERREGWWKGRICIGEEGGLIDREEEGAVGC